MTVSLEFLAAQVQRVIDKLGEQDAMFSALSARLDQTHIGLQHVEEKLDALRAQLERRLDRLEASP